MMCHTGGLTGLPTAHRSVSASTHGRLEDPRDIRLLSLEGEVSSCFVHSVQSYWGLQYVHIVPNILTLRVVVSKPMKRL